MDNSSSSYTSLSRSGKAHHSLFILSLLLSAILLLSIFNTASAAGLKKPKNLSPHGNGTELQPDFSWKPVVGATEYLLWINQGGKQLVNERISSTALGCGAVSFTVCTYSPAFSLVLNKWVRWGVKAFDATQQNNRSNWSNIRWYRVKKAAAPKTKTPHKTINDSTPAYSWRGVESANSYELIIRRGSTVVFSGSMSAAAAGCADNSDPCAYTPDVTLGNGNYRWRVRGVFDGGNGKWSNFRGFKVRDVVVTENQAPVAESQSVSTNEDASVAITLSGSDADSDALTFSVVTQPANGSLSGTAPNLTYTPTADFNGEDSFTFIANDGTTDSAAATITITVDSVNDVPTANAQSVSVDEDASVAITLSGSDADSDALTFSVVTQPANGSLSGAAPNLTYTPTADFNGEDSFTFIANDGTADSAAATTSIAINPIPEQPQNFSATAGNAQVLLNWDMVPDADSYAICLAEAPILDAVNCANGLPLTAQSNSLLIDGSVFNGGLENGTEYYFVVLAVETDTSGTQAFSEPSEQITATPEGVVQPTPTGRLNDTGITFCRATDGSTLSCDSTTVDGLGNPLVIAGQDGLSGRDVTNNDPNNGDAGFSFTKIGADGAALADQSQAWDETASGSEELGTRWSCVKDNATGLIWEVKQDDVGLHSKTDRYQWYQENNNGGFNGYNGDVDVCYGYDAIDPLSQCNTSAFVDRVNTGSLCGATDWRMPTNEELRSIIHYGVSARFNPAIDSDYFPNMIGSYSYWSSSPYADGTNNRVWVMNGGGSNTTKDKVGINHVRLIRSGQ